MGISYKCKKMGDLLGYFEIIRHAIPLLAVSFKAH